MLKDHFGGILKAGFDVFNPELGARANTDESEELGVENWSAIGVRKTGSGKLVTQRVKAADMVDVESLAVTVILGFPTSFSEGVPWKFKFSGSKESQDGKEDAESFMGPFALPKVAGEKDQEKGLATLAIRGS